jgi:hypothetical protein
MISTYHSHDTRTVTIRVKDTDKPILVLVYSEWMSGVDLKDHLLHSYLIEKKNVQVAHEAIWYTSEYLRSECHDI